VGDILTRSNRGADESRWASRTSNPLGGMNMSQVGSTPMRSRQQSQSGKQMVSKFISSRRQGLSPRTITFYQGYLNHSLTVIGGDITYQDISSFLESLRCTTGGKHAYFRVLRCFYTWLYSRRSGYNLNSNDNPMLAIEPPKQPKRILPSLTEQQVTTLIVQAENIRDKCIISLLADSGMRISELANIKEQDIDYSTQTITVVGKGNKERRTPFTARTAPMLKRISHGSSNSIWNINRYGIEDMLSRLERNTGIKCNPHVFRRAFACNLHRKGLSTLSIMHLGGWEDLSMVLRYTSTITFDDCLKFYEEVNK
jgi:integrase/recombinase XerC